MKVKKIVVLAIIVIISPLVAVAMGVIEMLVTPYQFIRYACEQLNKDSE